MSLAPHPAIPDRRDRARHLMRISLRGTRLATGLVLLAYVVTHLVNHSLGNISVAAMEWGLGWAGWAWWNIYGKTLLYGAFTIHLALGLWALYSRRPFRYRLAEALQLGFGLLIPLLLVQHIVATRFAFELHNVSKGYAQQLYKYFVDAPSFGILQAVTLVVVWAHGALGIYLWLRLKPFFPRISAPLLCIAMLVPVLALLGYVQGGRDFLELYADPAWRIAHLGPESLGTPAENAELAGIRSAITAGYVILVGLTLLARGIRRARERRRGLLSFTYPNGKLARVPSGTSVLEASRLHRIPHASVCGGRGRCSTCRVRVIGATGELSRPGAAEQAVLDRIGATSGVRLACQFRPDGDVMVAPLLAAGITLDKMRELDASAFGEERFIVAMFIDMRGSTRLAERRLPYDTVFLINRFLEAVGRAVVASGGVPNQFLGDGLMALFGLKSSPAEAARQGLEALHLIAANVDTLNRTLGSNLEEPIRFGIGLHAGIAVLGEIGDRENGRAVFTAIGDPVNVASRLQGLTKRFGVEVVISEAVFEAAAIEPDLPREETAIDGRDEKLWVRPLAKASQRWRESAFEVV